MKKRVAILGAGAAGLALALKLLDHNDQEIEVKIIEKEPMVGGIASGFEYQDLNFDFGSHKLHSAAPQEILNDIQEILGNDLLFRTGSSRIHFMNRFMNIPLSLKNISAGLPFAFIAAIMGNVLAKPFKKLNRNSGSYAEILSSQYGAKLCNSLYFPYLEKVWGFKPGQRALVQIKNQGKMSSPILPVDLPLSKKSGEQKYYYPKHGFMQLFEEMMRRIWKKGGKFLLMQKFIRLSRSTDGCLTCILEDGSSIEFDVVFSTIPLNSIINSIRQIYPENVTEIVHNPLEVPEIVLETAKKLQYRNMILCYLILNTGRFSPYDTHYFPEPGILFSRVSEPKNYSSSLVPNGKTGLCVEIPCSAGDDIWHGDDAVVIDRATSDLKKAGLAVDGLVIDTVVKRFENAFLQFDPGLESKLKVINDYLETIPDLIVLQQQSPATHDFLHHTIETAYQTISCLQKDFYKKNL